MVNYRVDYGLRIRAHAMHACMSARNASSHKHDSSTSILIRKPHVAAEFDSYTHRFYAIFQLTTTATFIRVLHLPVY